ncbi:DUF1622 domain-containing protein [Arthrobacter globiformis]|uniref:DUF1622 domain-containing protein n=1 Tax=Arthrobacter globiformis TaxID=1665 RepID=UPI00397BE5B2
MDFRQIIESAGQYLDFAGVAVMVIGAVISVPLAVRGRRLPGTSEGRKGSSPYRQYRQLLGRSILLGLELLVAADIIRTVAVTPTFTSVGVLAVIVVIRTFLSFSLELEITGRWPWQKADDPSSAEASGTKSI